MHKYLTLLLVIFSVSFSGCAKKKKTEPNGEAPVLVLNKADFPNVPQSVYGRWLNDETITKDGITMHMKLYVNRTQVGIEVDCDGMGRTAGASFAVNAAIDTRNIQILEAASKAEKSTNGRLNCSAQIAKGTFGYFVSNNNMILTSPRTELKNMVFTRIQ